MPEEEDPYNEHTWSEIAGKGDTFITSMGCIYQASHAYLQYWRVVREPTTLKPSGLKVFEGMVEPALLSFANDLATYGVRPMAQYPAVRSPQFPYSSVMDNPTRTSRDLWEDLVKGRIMLFTQKRQHLVGPLMESQLEFATQQDVTKKDGVKVRYISDPRIEINERIDPATHPRVRVPKHANVIRMILYWKRRYPTIPALLCKRDAKGAFKLMPVSIRGLTHMGVQFSNYLILYLPLFFVWKPPPNIAARNIDFAVTICFLVRSGTT